MNPHIHLDPGEVITRTVHRHWIDLVPSLFFALVLTLAAAGLAFLYGRFPLTLPFPPLIMLGLIVILTGLAAIVFAIGLFTFRNNILVFTNTHLIEIEQIGLFNRRVSQLDLNKVQDASAQNVGVFATLLDYGNVQFQTAGEQEKFIFQRVADPDKLADDVLLLRDQTLTAIT